MSDDFEVEHGEPLGRRFGGYSQKTFVYAGIIVILATAITLLAAFSISRDSEGAGLPPVVAGAVTTPTAAASAPTEQPTATAVTSAPSPTAIATVSPEATVVAAPGPLPDAPTATPIEATPSPSSLAPDATALARAIEAEFGVRIVEVGQDWGTTDELQARNVSAVRDALASLPPAVRLAVNADIPLAFLSNHIGATEAGWAPYGQREANYYTNEDLLESGPFPSNQVVLQPGSISQTIAHEVMHAYQMRDVPTGQYVLALLTPEMKSFMTATGWTQLGTDDDVRAAAASGWDAVNLLFQYDGRVLTYNNEFGDSLTLYTPNPVEAFAEAAGLYYGHNEALLLPDWPEYWDWFAANVG